MLRYFPLSNENVNEAVDLVCSVFSGDCNTEDSPVVAYRASLDREQYQDFICRHNLGILEYFVVKKEDENKIIGATGWYTRITDDKNTIWLGWYCLSQEERGKGFGRKILEWTMDKAREKGYTKMKLYTSTDPNEATAQILYEKLGFEIVDEELKEGESYKTLYRECIL